MGKDFLNEKVRPEIISYPIRICHLSFIDKGVILMIIHSEKKKKKKAKREIERAPEEDHNLVSSNLCIPSYSVRG